MPDSEGKRLSPITCAQGKALPARWDGVLSAGQIAWCRENAVALAYDPMQVGWVLEDDGADDAQGVPHTPLCWHAGAAARVGLRRGQAADVPLFRQMLDDPDLMQHMPDDWPVAMTRQMAHNVTAISVFTGRHDVQVVTLGTAPVGQVRLSFGFSGGKPETAELGFWVGRGHRGHGLGRAVVDQATRRAFDDHPWIRRLVAFTRPAQQAARSCLVRAGYQDQGHRDDGCRCFVIHRG